MPQEIRQTARYERKREMIVDAATVLFNARGLGGTTLSDVAQSVGLTTTSITYYYRRKEDLAAACVTRAIEGMEEILAIAERETTSQARLQRFVSLYFEVQARVATGASPAIITFWDLRAMTGPGAEAAARLVVGLFRRLRKWFEDPNGPSFSRAEQNARAFLIFSSLLHAKEWLVFFEAEDFPRCAECFADVLIAGVAALGVGWRENPSLPPVPQSATKEVSHEAFLRAATELINEQGYRGASVDRISAKLSVTKGSFYHHNDTKDGLVAECFERSFDVMRVVHRSVPREMGTGWVRLNMLVAAFVRYQRSEHGPLLRDTALAAMPENMRPALVNAMRRLSYRTVGVVVDGIVDQSIRPVDPVIAAKIIAGAVNAAAELHHWVRDITGDEAVTLFARPCLMGVFSKA